MQAKRYNQGKPNLHYLDPWYHALCEVVRVCTKGEEKYERGNYLLGQPHSELLSAARRHEMKFGDTRRPDYDEESSCHHLAHAIWNLLQLLQTDMTTPTDTRSKWDDRLRKPELTHEVKIEPGVKKIDLDITVSQDGVEATGYCVYPRGPDPYDQDDLGS